MEEPQLLAEEERGANVSRAKLSSQGKYEADCRHLNLENQLIQVLHGTEEKTHDSKGVGVNWGSNTAGCWLETESLVCPAGPLAITGQS